MDNNKLLHILTVFIVITFLSFGNTSAFEITLGPYLQSIQENSAIIAFETDRAKKLTLDYGENPGAFESVTEKTKAKKHKIVIKNLTSFTKYYYEIRAGNKDLAQGDSYHFFTSKSSDAEDITFAVIGDSGDRTSGQKDVIREIKSANPDFILHTGDIAYPSGSNDDFRDNYFAPFSTLLRNTCIWTSPGNHEYKSNDGSPYFKFFYLPRNNPAKSESYYSFDNSDSHFVSIDTTLFEEDAAFRKKIIKWLKEDLASTDKMWKFVFFHYPPYNCGYHSASDLVKDRLVPIFEKYNVDIVFSGHDHDYQRTYPLINDNKKNAGDNPDYVDPAGPIYIITGGGGSDRIDDVGNDCSFLAYGKGAYHFVKVTISGNFLTLKAVGANGNAFDTMTITKN
ncbi:MAG: purple acid phosphatase [Candidatus Schekmanbacteria bacterium]|nr:purple acid phosphatase [Candidatus Schekmanbacteria bacterium]